MCFRERCSVSKMLTHSVLNDDINGMKNYRYMYGGIVQIMVDVLDPWTVVHVVYVL